MERREALDARARERSTQSISDIVSRDRNDCTATIAAAEAEIDERARRGRRRAGRRGRHPCATRCCATTNAAGAEQGRGRGAARRHDVPGVPPDDPVDGSRTDPPRRGTRGLVLRQLLARSSCRDASRRCSRRRRAPASRKCAVYCDGGSRGNPGPSAIGAVVFDRSVEPPRRLATVSERIGVTTNNVAEYEALIAGLDAAAQLRRAGSCTFAPTRCSSCKQLNGKWKVKQPHLRPLHERRPRTLLAALRRRRSATRAARGEHRRRRARERGAGRADRVVPMVLWYRVRLDLRRLERLPEPRARLPPDRGRRAAAAVISTHRSVGQAYAHTLLSAVTVLAR